MPIDGMPIDGMPIWSTNMPINGITDYTFRNCQGSINPTMVRLNEKRRATINGYPAPERSNWSLFDLILPVIEQICSDIPAIYRSYIIKNQVLPFEPSNSDFKR